MTDCTSCVHKGSRCTRPPGKHCTKYEREERVRRTFEFETGRDWFPECPGCWFECPFSALIPLGQTCRFLTSDGLQCPFNET